MPPGENDRLKASIQCHVNTNESIIMLVKQLAFAQQPLKQVILE